MSRMLTKTMTILDGETDSDIVTFNSTSTQGGSGTHVTPMSMFVPTEFTGTTLTFKDTDDTEGTPVNIYDTDNSTAYTITVVKNVWMKLDFQLLAATVMNMQVVSDAAQSGSDCEIIFKCRTDV